MRTLFFILVICAIYIAIVYNGHLVDVWSTDIIQKTLDNNNWRKVLYTSDNLQIVTMSVPIGEELGWEVHKGNDQLFRVVEGTGLLETRDANNNIKTTKLTNNIVSIVPKNNYHNLKNIGSQTLKFYTLYGPPHHKNKLIDVTHADEIARES